MAPERASALLGLWDECREVDAISRTIAMCAAAEPVLDPDDAATLPMGACTARLLRLRHTWRPGDIEATVQCPTCATDLEFAFDPSSLAHEAHSVTIEPLSVGRRHITWRPITGRDLQVAAREPDVVSAERAIIDACVVEISEGGHRLEDVELSDAERTALAGAIEAADPLIEARFELRCVECGQSVTAQLPIPDVVWVELDAIARRLISEVDLLARTYGWTESECLALTPARRSTYLELAGGGAQ